MLSVICSIVMINSKRSNNVPNLFGYSLVTILSGSMTNSGFNEDDTVIVKSIDTKEIEVGDVIAYYTYIETYTDIKTADRGVKEVNTNDFKLLSVDHPQLENLHLLYVRGTNKELDNAVMVTHFNSFKGMKQYIERLKKATKVWNDNDDDEVKAFSYIPIA